MTWPDLFCPAGFRQDHCRSDLATESDTLSWKFTGITSYSFVLLTTHFFLTSFKVNAREAITMPRDINQCLQFLFWSSSPPPQKNSMAYQGDHSLFDIIHKLLRYHGQAFWGNLSASYDNMMIWGKTYFFFFFQQSYHTIITTKHEFDIMLYAGNTVYWEWSNTESYVLHYVYVLYLLNTK